VIRKAALALALAVLAGILFHAKIFAALGSYLVREEQPKQADLALVLAGDATGNRVLRAAELVRQGYVPKVVVSGPSGVYGLYECDLAIPFAVRAGYPESYFIHFEHDAHSTQEEAVNSASELKKLGAKHVLLVTSDYHTRRAGRILKAAAPDIDFTVVAAPDKYFSPGSWWHNREGQKTFLFEWEKTVANWFGV
jgi:uncharacterized SAM-binding protein YcdF (DUF218 family)